ncbi:hypothetical protein Pmar_PMAR013875 [Perkinsus marinus ATCC 50983]|uniref:Uncharacterized protein n=1 Tax=Perkinsus marinus (strain ATCC 50983 / TXsc) TaxID=423536 RepID=C5K848_PERM5|nr:hypothetical protein Pmar_PMAR013875 [Perkinsus marinus ATCC 50983]EER19345.1 hypothetical protein Pmar_PMAR013875 [Perkinsus marinus ATCC 50983]|eukprot:XP_002787549.1 hypothetical protein Pmar_PMAR013875 [Perkinsus marinus ATCC 50983]
MSKTIGASSQPSDEAFIREVLRTWNGSKQRRRRAKRPEPVSKKPRKEIRSGPLIGSDTGSDISDDDMVIQQADDRDRPVLRAQRRAKYVALRNMQEYFAADADSSESE